MANDKKIKIIVKITKTERRELEFHQDQVTGREIKEKAGIPLESELAAERDGKYHVVANDTTVHIKNGEHFTILPPHVIHYSVNDEPQYTHEKELTPVKIMEDAGIDPSKNYLVEIKKDGHQESFKDAPEKHIHMHDGMKFITCFMGTKPVS
jgi:hypothetical protein